MSGFISRGLFIISERSTVIRTRCWNAGKAVMLVEVKEKALGIIEIFYKGLNGLLVLAVLVKKTSGRVVKECRIVSHDLWKMDVREK